MTGIRPVIVGPDQTDRANRLGRSLRHLIDVVRAEDDQRDLDRLDRTTWQTLRTVLDSTSSLAS